MFLIYYEHETFVWGGAYVNAILVLFMYYKAFINILNFSFYIFSFNLNCAFLNWIHFLKSFYEALIYYLFLFQH